MILRERIGSVYEELTTTRYVKGVGRVLKRRWVGEVSINHKRYRCRSTNKQNVEAFVNDLIQKAGLSPLGKGEAKMFKHDGYYDRFDGIMKEQSKRLHAFYETQREQKRQERAQYWKERAKRLFPYGYGERYIHSYIPHKAFRVLRSVRVSDRIALHVKDARKLLANKYNLWRIEHDKKEGKTYIVFSEKRGQLFSVYDHNATTHSNEATDKLDGLWGMTLAHGQLLDIISWEKRGNELWFEIKAGKICKR